MAAPLFAKDIRVEFPTKKVFDAVTVSVDAGDRIGIVGKNGDGKSTLLKVLAGLCTPDGGEVVRRSDVTVGFLGQHDELDDTATVGSAIVGDAPDFQWASDKRVRGILQALVADLSWDTRIATLSGGQRRRVDLARLLIGDWDVLILDEPTNHLDMKAIAWLAAHLKSRWPKGSGSLLAVTHDRWFLDEVALQMWEVHDGTVEPFEGGFSAYVLQRVERDRLAQAAEQKRQNQMRKELAWLSRGARARATKPKFHLATAQALIADVPPLRDTLELKQASMTRLGKQVVELCHVSAGYDGALVLKDLDWIIGPGERIGILGENGAGKTTLLNLIEGRLQPSAGQVKIGKSVHMAILSQRLEELEAVRHDRVREVLGRHKTRLTIDGKSITTARLLERLGFSKDHLQARIEELSGGQKRRLQLLLTLADEPNVLILDEPGNDMDTDMLAVMEDLLDSWPGTLLLVSHDRYLTERVTDDQYALVDGTLRHMPGGVDEYLAQPEKGGQSLFLGSPPEKKGLSPFLGQSLGGGEAYQARKQLASTERKMETLEGQISATEAGLHDADPSDYVALGQIQAELQDLRNQMEALEETWLDLTEKLG